MGASRVEGNPYQDTVGTCPVCGRPMYRNWVRSYEWHGDPNAVHRGAGGMCSRDYRLWRAQNPSVSPRVLRGEPPAPEPISEPLVAEPLQREQIMSLPEPAINVLFALLRRFSAVESRALADMLGLFSTEF